MATETRGCIRTGHCCAMLGIAMSPRFMREKWEFWRSGQGRVDDGKVNYPEDIDILYPMLAGRCVGCGACSRACPMDVKLWRYLNKLCFDTKELFGYEAGVDEKLSPPLTTYKENDPNEFVK